MKYILSLGLLSALCFTSEAQTLSNGSDSLSYALGQDIANSVKRLNVDVNPEILGKSIQAAMEGKENLLGAENVQSVISDQLKKATIARDSKLKAESQVFLEKNKSNPKVKVDSSGVQYEILTEGTGLHPGKSDTVVVHYVGKLVDGTSFDSSYDRDEPLVVDLNENIIQGWKNAIPLMKQGGKYRFYIPYELGYGESGSGPIPPFSTLVFDIELLEIKKGGQVEI